MSCLDPLRDHIETPARSPASDSLAIAMPPPTVLGHSLMPAYVIRLESTMC